MSDEGVMRVRVTSAAVAVTGATLIAAAFAQAAGKTVPVTSGKYAGTTSEKVAITFSISKRAISHLKTEVGYNGKCGQGGGPGFTISASGVAIASNGRFSKKITLVGPVAAVPNQNGTLTGKASGSTVTGTIVDTTLAKPGKCNGYTETFRATRTR